MEPMNYMTSKGTIKVLKARFITDYKKIWRLLLCFIRYFGPAT